MRTWLARIRDTFRTQLWPIPTLAVLAALMLGLALPELDSVLSERMSEQARDLLFGGDADAARSLLGAIASSLITVTALTFSLTVVTLQLASSQFSPRLLRTFTGDVFVQVTLALFLATFTYSLTVLRAVRSAAESGQGEFVPRFAVTLAFVLAVASVLALVLFLAHLTAQIRVETMLSNVHSDATDVMRSVLDERDPAAMLPAPDPSPPADAVPLVVAVDGFLTWIDEKDLLDVAEDASAVLRIDVYPGSFLVEGTPLGTAWSIGGRTFDADSAERIAERIAGCIHTGFERTSAQDVGFGLRQLVDVANKALSPGINDPTTAVHALGHISAFLCDLTTRDLGPKLLRDGADHIRVVLRRPQLADYVELGISQPRRYGADDPQVLAKILQVLLDLSYRAPADHRPLIREQLARLRTTVDEQDFDSHERAFLAKLAAQVDQNLGSPTRA